MPTPPASNLTRQTIDKSKIEQTLNLPKTDFPSHIDVAATEQAIKVKWQAQHPVTKFWQTWQQQQQKIHPEAFIVIDGPPYANGPIHMGHALNKILKDFYVRFNTVNYQYLPWVFGWDFHGMPIEHQIIKQNLIKTKLSIVDFQNLCLTYAKTQQQLQIQGFEELGLFWTPTISELTYTTHDHAFQMNELAWFWKFYSQQNYIFQTKMPVYWSWSARTSLADSEIIYQDRLDDEIFASFIITKLSEQLQLKVAKTLKIEVVIYTTTPWTLLANQAIACNPEATYILVESNQRYFIISADTLNSFCQRCQIVLDQTKIITKFKGTDLCESQYVLPFTNEVHKIYPAEFVLFNEGTGLVHIAPGHGHDDYLLSLKYPNELKLVTVVNEQGEIVLPVNLLAKYQEQWSSSIFYLDFNAKMLESLAQLSCLWGHGKLNHSYPHDWRTKKPVYFLATKQWFFNVKQVFNPTHQLSYSQTIQQLSGTNKKNWMLLWAMLIERSGWCISRQRRWGTCIPMAYHELPSSDQDFPLAKMNTLFDDIYHYLDKNTTQSWWTAPLENIFSSPTKLQLPTKKETDILDVWFDSGFVSMYIYQKYLAKLTSKPLTIWIEGRDQLRGWFNASSILMFAKDQLQINTVASEQTLDLTTIQNTQLFMHGFVLDKHHKKMAKSEGNNVDPVTVIQKFGADSLRLWIWSIDVKKDVVYDEDIMRQVKQTYHKWRNTIKFLFANLNDLHFEANSTPWTWEGLLNKILSFDNKELNANLKSNSFKITNLWTNFNLYLCYLLLTIFNSAKNCFNHFDLEKLYQSVNQFCVVSLSQLYFPAIKNILYLHAPESSMRQQIQYSLLFILFLLHRLLEPFLPFLSWELKTKFSEKNYFSPTEQPPLAGWIFQHWNNSNSDTVQALLIELFTLRDKVNLLLENNKANKVLANTNQAALIGLETLLSHPYTIDTLQPESDFWPRFFQVARVQFTHDQVSSLEIKKHSTNRCDRCREYFLTTEFFQNYQLCQSCAQTMNQKFADIKALYN